ncbi:hypothetical protein [Polynucleobacter paneuropaeus]|uniref:hypothetical protein n=1 Tax=Polynucleobacter paneuropaeus TaxID=2527775 RepID=UPI001BFEDBA8|nr:hypothetical protein [Polynucleobacter paneuropaeus]
MVNQDTGHFEGSEASQNHNGKVRNKGPKRDGYKDQNQIRDELIGPDKDTLR